MKKNIVESIDMISEEELLVQELDKRLSFDMLVSSLGDTEKGCPTKQSCDFICSCIMKEVIGCTCKGYYPDPATCGVRG